MPTNSIFQASHSTKSASLRIGLVVLVGLSIFPFHYWYPAVRNDTLLLHCIVIYLGGYVGMFLGKLTRKIIFILWLPPLCSVFSFALFGSASTLKNGTNTPFSLYALAIGLLIGLVEAKLYKASTKGTKPQE